MSAENRLIGLYTDTFGFAPAAVLPLAGAGSNRRYFRITSPDGVSAPLSVIGTFGTDCAENKSFISLARHFAQKNLPVPGVIAVSADNSCYLQEDLGDVSLFSIIRNASVAGGFDEETIHLLEGAAKSLAEVQYFGAEGLDWGICPQQAMDSHMIRWDLNYFKYCFLKQTRLDFSESRLEEEFDYLHDLLLKHAKRATTFMVRDFQSRNIMLANGSVPYLIDFQGGRRGPVEYDVASFLWQAKAGIPKVVRDAVIDSYVKSARFINPAFDEATFRGVLPYFVLFRILQTLGAYGYRGISEGKSHFMASIPLALANLETHLAEYGLDKEFPYISDLAAMLRSTPVIQEVADRLNVAEYDGLTVTVTSFSYKKGFPADFSGNGGGFVFDCRAVHNPGRYDQYKMFTGRDAAVKSFLEEDGEITTFLKNAWGLVDASVARYLKRGFNSLSVNFGCTGGRHRSVYSAEATARHIADSFPQARVVLYHREQGILETFLPAGQ